MTATEPFWPDNARLAVSFSLIFEAGGQPISGAGGVIPDPIENNLPDLPTNAFFQYGVYEGIPRILDLMDKHQVKLGSFMIGRAVEKVPELAREIVNRGHEAAAHGRTWENSYFLNADAERRFIADSVEAIQKVTGLRPIGWNAYWMRNSPHTLDILQLLGFNEPSMDEPFIVKLKGGDLVTVPYTFHMNDIVSFPFQDWNPAAYELLTAHLDDPAWSKNLACTHAPCMRRAKKRKNLSSARHYDQIRFRFHTANSQLGH
jgi:peptidoglycan/xylan/chitin deacetylase (PgdA/CDA1 family)